MRFLSGRTRTSFGRNSAVVDKMNSKAAVVSKVVTDKTEEDPDEVEEGIQQANGSMQQKRRDFDDRKSNSSQSKKNKKDKMKNDEATSVDKKQKKKKKKKSNGEPAVMVDRIPTVHSYNSNDSAHEIDEERSRASRYTVEGDDWDISGDEDDGREEIEDGDDRYSQYDERMMESDRIWMSNSDDSCPARWQSWDDNDDSGIRRLSSLRRKSLIEVEDDREQPPSEVAEKTKKKKKKKKKKQSKRSTEKADREVEVASEAEKDATTADVFIDLKQGLKEKSSTDASVKSVEKKSKSESIVNAGKKEQVSSTKTTATTKEVPDEANMSNKKIQTKQKKSRQSSKSNNEKKKTSGGTELDSDKKEITKPSVAPSKRKHANKYNEDALRTLSMSMSMSEGGQKAASKKKKSDGKDQDVSNVQPDTKAESEVEQKPQVETKKPKQAKRSFSRELRKQPKKNKTNKKKTVSEDAPVVGEYRAGTLKKEQTLPVPTTISTTVPDDHDSTLKDQDSIHSRLHVMESALDRDVIDGSQKPQLRRSDTPMELDEYSQIVNANDEPALVQCLKFYSCGAAAVTAEKVLNWPSTLCSAAIPKISDEVLAQRSQDNENYLLSPGGPKVEVILDELRPWEKHDLEVQESNESDKVLAEAPELSRTQSCVTEVTGMKLHLDDDSTMGTARTNRQGDEFSITSCEIPTVIPSNLSESIIDGIERARKEWQEEEKPASSASQGVREAGLRGLKARLSKKRRMLAKSTTPPPSEKSSTVGDVGDTTASSSTKMTRKRPKNVRKMFARLRLNKN